MSTTETELTAREKFPCPACGAQAEWNPAKQKLVCPFCGTESPYQINPASGADRGDRSGQDAARAAGLAARLARGEAQRAVPELPRGDGVRSRRASRRTASSAGLRRSCAYDEIKDPISPQSLLPFRVADTTVREQIRRWYASKWFAPGKLKARALVDTVHGVYLPYWTFDAQVELPVARRGGALLLHDRDLSRRPGPHRRRGRCSTCAGSRLQGSVDHFFDDEPVPGSQGVSIDSAAGGRAVSHEGTGAVRRRDGLGLRRRALPDRPDRRGAGVDRSDDRAAARRCARSRSLATRIASCEIAPQFSGRTFKHVLVPVWLLTYTYGARAFQVLVNGYTGKMEGTYPKSPWKVIFAVVLVLLFVLLLLYSQSQ